MIKLVYYCYRNLVYYNQSRSINNQRLKCFSTVNSIDDTKLFLTNCVLATVGLKVVYKINQQIPWYIPLSKVQKEWIKLVKEQGYLVGLS